MEQKARITLLLEQWRQGDEEAGQQVLPAIYDELCALARRQLRRERAGHTLETSALVHEAYLRLVVQKEASWRSRAHFLAIAATMMRRILSNHGRDRGRGKRGGGVVHLPLEEESLAGFAQRTVGFEVLDDALQALARVEAQQAKIVEMRYFGGMTSEEIAEVLAISVPTVTRRWRVARAWLYRYLEGTEADAGP